MIHVALLGKIGLVINSAPFAHGPAFFLAAGQKCPNHFGKRFRILRRGAKSAFCLSDHIGGFSTDGTQHRLSCGHIGLHLSGQGIAYQRVIFHADQ